MQGKWKKGIIATAVVVSLFAGGLVAFAATSSEDSAIGKPFRGAYKGFCFGNGPAETLPSQRSRGFCGDKADCKGFMKERRAPLTNDLAEALGMTHEEIREQVQAGKTILQIAEEKGMTAEQFEAKIREIHEQKVATLLEEGKITEEKAELLKERMEKRFN
ncbi:hypothetical protein [Heliorestis convoluta]|uniref:SHOCT domain-containing protein n=1 Tax=Heliorestis convoluta TaxID=356322 RepID=A0A5Q2MZA8_9FIRM|nr:hypothetical protein [Heliorestis convoluta]QGG46262.1 hypothetical protein FTV88_0083 [Heliorestis convoluta]